VFTRILVESKKFLTLVVLEEGEKKAEVSPKKKLTDEQPQQRVVVRFCRV
jgi:hypothetical protein